MAMTHAAHPAALRPAPACPGCGQPMHPTPTGHHTCTCDGTAPATYDLPRGDTPAIRPRERRIRTTTAIDVWDDYQPERQKQPGDGPGTKRKGKTAASLRTMRQI